ncbi:hypothetical protein B9Z55_023625 [Caenorhabditis nigoni]|nr:hypothetical protein B9Z55_023625 [Caenorhabditis nigoni]
MAADQTQKQFKSHHLIHPFENLLPPRIDDTVPDTSVCRKKCSQSQNSFQSLVDSFSTHNSIPLPIPIEDIKQEPVDPEYPDYVNYANVRDSENTIEKFEDTSASQYKHHYSYKELVESDDPRRFCRLYDNCVHMDNQISCLPMKSEGYGESERIDQDDTMDVGSECFSPDAKRIRRNSTDPMLINCYDNVDDGESIHNRGNEEGSVNDKVHDPEATLSVFNSEANNQRYASFKSLSTLKSYSYYASDEEMGSASGAESEDSSIFGSPTSESTVLRLPSPIATEDMRSVFSEDDVDMDIEIKDEAAWETDKYSVSTDADLTNRRDSLNSILSVLFPIPVALNAMKKEVLDFDYPDYKCTGNDEFMRPSAVTMENLGVEGCLDTITSHKGSISQEDKPSSRSSFPSKYIVTPLPVALADIKQEIIDPEYPDYVQPQSPVYSRIAMKESKDLNGGGQFGESSENGNQSEVYTHGLLSALHSPVPPVNPNTKDYEAASNSLPAEDTSGIRWLQTPFRWF